MGGIERRDFLKVLGAGVLIAVGAPAWGQAETQPRAARGGRGVDVAARVHIGKDGAITVMTGKVEGGQGARGEITQAAAEELFVSPERIELVMGDTALCPDDGGTFGSRTTPGTLPSVRMGCALAREILVAAACAKWEVETTEVEVRGGKIIHPLTRREMTFGELVGDDSSALFKGPVPKGVGVTAVKEWQVMGTSVMRPGARTLATGGHEYPSDVVRDGMLYGAIVRPPSYGAKLKSVDVGAVGGMKGVTAMRDGDFVAVMAEGSFAARKGVEAIAKTAVWDPRPTIGVGELYEHLKTTAKNVPENPFQDEMTSAKQMAKAEYHVAYVQHGPLEPRAAVAEWVDGKVTVWTGTQNPFGVRGELMKALGVGTDAVRIIVPDFGGGFGGKHSGEAALEAARMAKAAGKPVKVRWTRDEEFTWAYFRPAGVIVAEAGVDGEGKLSSWYFVNINSGNAGLETPYGVAKKKVQTVPANGPLKAGSYRGLAATANHFARESFMDELARGAGKDPLAFRLANLKDERLIAVLQAAAGKFGWTAERPKMAGRGIGLACGTEKGSYVAACVELAVDEKTKAIRVMRVCQAFECGKIVNPVNLMSQVQGAIVMGLGPALREEVRFEKGTIINGTFADYEVPRFSDLPALEIELIDRPDLPSAGAGETPIVAIAPAIANAVCDATGVRVREMPIRLAKA